MSSPGKPTGSASRGWAYLLAVLASVAVAVQARLNGEFRLLVGDAVQAAFWSFLIGLALLVVIVSCRSDQRRAAVRFGRALRDGFPRWQTLGGLAGATMIIGQAASVPVLGVALFTVLLVAGQTVMSLAVDRWGLAPGGRRAVTTARVLGAVLMIVGVTLAASGRLSGDVVWWWLAAITVVGALLPFQQAVNAQVAAAARSPMVAATVNFAVGSVALASAVVVRALLDVAPLAVPPSPLEHPVVWSAGPLGVFFVAVAAVAVPRLGVLVFGLITIAGQVVASLVIDAVGDAVPVTATLVLGVLLSVVAVVVGSLRGMGQSAPWQR